jgi:hypothetical protein
MSEVALEGAAALAMTMLVKISADQDKPLN